MMYPTIQLYPTMKRWLGWTTFLLVCCAGSGAVWASPASDVIQKTSDALQKVIDDGRTYFATDPERFYDEVYNVLDPAVDFEAFARGVMAVHYRRATPEQRKRFVETFKRGLVRTYGKALLDFDQGKVAIVPEDKPPRDPAKPTVRMEITTKEGKVYPVDYAMAQSKDGSWRMRNIVINGINIGLTYRNQFASAMKSQQTTSNLDQVIDGWSETIAHTDPVAGEKPAEPVTGDAVP